MSTDKKLYWLDDSDLYLVSKRLNSLRTTQLKNWRWVRYIDDQYENDDEALSAAITELGVPTMFDPGKVVYCYGVPDCQARLAEYIPKIPDKILFIVIAKPNKTLSLFKAAQALEDKKLAVIEEVKDSSNKSDRDKLDWVKERAQALDLEVDDGVSSLLVDMFGFNLNKLYMELLKLRSCSVDGIVTPWLVEEACRGTGDADVKRLCLMILNGRVFEAHELLSRLLARREHPFALMGFMMDWITRLTVVGNFDNETKDQIGQMLKWKKKDEKKKKKDEPKTEKQDDEPNDSIPEAGKGESIPTFANPKGLYYSFKERGEANRTQAWAQGTMLQMGMMQLALRQAPSGDWKRYGEIMHHFIDRVIGE